MVTVASSVCRKKQQEVSSRLVGLENNGKCYEIVLATVLAGRHVVSERCGPRETDLQMRKCFLKNRGFWNQRADIAVFSVSY